MVTYNYVYKDSTLVSKAELANSNWEKCKGLMFSKQKDILFIFKKDAFLKFHMVFVFYPIDIIFMDHTYRIVDLKRRFRPFTMYYSRAKSSYVLELAAGTIKKYSLELGDVLDITEKEKILKPITTVKKIELGKPKRKSSTPTRKKVTKKASSKKTASKKPVKTSSIKKKTSSVNKTKKKTPKKSKK